ncbi:MAG: hypothetical protein WC140_04460 [Bacteroidales bacterium]
MKIINAEDINQNIEMSELIDVAKKAYEMSYNGEATTPLRTITDLGEGNPLVFFKPACDNTNKEVSIKILNQLKHTSDKGYPTIQGIILLIDGEKNQILAVINGSLITALRTGAASGIAAKILSREDSENLVVFGAGAQSYTQIKGILAVREIKKVTIYDRYEPAIKKLIKYFSYVKDVTFVNGTHEEMVNDENSNYKTGIKNADIICTVTNSTSKLFETKDLKPGVHINAFGSFAKDMRELPDDVFTNAKLYVDNKESCFAESGDIITPLAKGFINDNNYQGEIAELIYNKIEGRTAAEQRTIFKSVGIATQDLAVAQYIYNKAVKHNFGVNIEL